MRYRIPSVASAQHNTPMRVVNAQNKIVAMSHGTHTAILVYEAQLCVVHRTQMKICILLFDRESGRAKDWIWKKKCIIIFIFILSVFHDGSINRAERFWFGENQMIENLVYIFFIKSNIVCVKKNGIMSVCDAAGVGDQFDHKLYRFSVRSVHHYCWINGMCRSSETDCCGNLIIYSNANNGSADCLYMDNYTNIKRSQTNATRSASLRVRLACGTWFLPILRRIGRCQATICHTWCAATWYSVRIENFAYRSRPVGDERWMKRWTKKKKTNW